MKKRWLNYQKDFDYAKEIDFIAVCKNISIILEKTLNN